MPHTCARSRECGMCVCDLISIFSAHFFSFSLQQKLVTTLYLHMQRYSTSDSDRAKKASSREKKGGHVEVENEKWFIHLLLSQAKTKKQQHRCELLQSDSEHTKYAFPFSTSHRLCKVNGPCSFEISKKKKLHKKLIKTYVFDEFNVYVYYFFMVCVCVSSLCGIRRTFF